MEEFVDDNVVSEDEEEDDEHSILAMNANLRFLNLTDSEMIWYNESVIRSGEMTDVMLKHDYGGDMTRDVLRRLSPGIWLNCDLINTYLHMLKETRPQCVFFATYFAQKLIEMGKYKYTNVSSFTLRRHARQALPDINIFDKEKLFYPINVGQSHWVLTVIYPQEKKIDYYDSIYDDVTAKA